MVYYKVLLEDRGDTIFLSPSIPKHPMKGEDTKVPRICVAPTILQCIQSIDCINILSERSDNKLPIYVYATITNAALVLDSPTSDQVPDKWKTGEMWIRSMCPFIKISKGYISKQFDFPNVCYSRYSFTIDDELPLDLITGPVVYGEDFCFSFIDKDPKRVKDAIEYHDKHPYTY